VILNPGTAGCPAVCYAEGRAASDANRGQAPRACHAPVPARAAAGASGTVTCTVWYAAMPSRTSLINISVPPLVTARRESPALPGPNGGDHLARCRIDHGAAVDHHGRDRLVTAGHGANESGRIGIPPDVDLPDGKMMPPQDKTQPPTEHTARPPVQGDPGRGTGLLAGWAHQAIQPLVVVPPPAERSGITGRRRGARSSQGVALTSLVPESRSGTHATRS
jgi:hypothetical protein